MESNGLIGIDSEFKIIKTSLSFPVDKLSSNNWFTNDTVLIPGDKVDSVDLTSDNILCVTNKGAINFSE